MAEQVTVNRNNDTDLSKLQTMLQQCLQYQKYAHGLLILSMTPILWRIYLKLLFAEGMGTLACKLGTRSQTVKVAYKGA